MRVPRVKASDRKLIVVIFKPHELASSRRLDQLGLLERAGNDGAQQRWSAGSAGLNIGCRRDLVFLDVARNNLDASKFLHRRLELVVSEMRGESFLVPPDLAHSYHARVQDIDRKGIRDAAILPADARDMGLEYLDEGI